MRINTSKPNTLQTPNINKSTNKSSGKVAATACSIQNSAEKYPATSEKTVHNQDIKNLKANISKNLSEISKKIKSIGTSDGRGCKVTLSNNTMTALGTKLSKLKNDIQHYKNELNRSTYQHNSNKEKALSKLEDKVNNTTGSFQASKNKNSYLTSQGTPAKLTESTSANRLQRQKDYENQGYK